MGGCAGCSVPLLFACKNIQVFSRRGLFHYRYFCSRHCFAWFQSPVGFVTYHQIFCIFLNHKTISSFTRSPKGHCKILYFFIHTYAMHTKRGQHYADTQVRWGLRLAYIKNNMILTWAISTFYLTSVCIL